MTLQSNMTVRRAPRNTRAFTLIEVIVASSILALGLLSIMQVFPYGIQTSQRAEDLTRASLLAQSIFEGLKTDPINYPIIPGMPSSVIPIPGNGFDDDTNNVRYNVQQAGMNRNQGDLNQNRLPDADYDGMPELDGLGQRITGIAPNGLDDDGDGVPDDNGDSGTSGRYIASSFTAIAADGDPYYDPERDLDEEYANGIDDDRDGLIDEDVRLASVRVLGRGTMLPLLAGDGTDNDGGGEDNDNNNQTPAVADGIDNDGDGMIDEGIDEEIWDGRDNDKDGRIDEDTQLAAFPFAPAKFPAPYSQYGWQIRVGRVPNNGRLGLVDTNGDGIVELGDGIDNDGDGFIDEEMPDGLDLDFPTRPQRGLAFLNGYTQNPTRDGLTDEDTIYAPLPNWRRVEVLITWGGDGEDNDVDKDGKESKDARQVDPAYVDPAQNPGSGNRQQNARISYGGVRWGIDEEKIDGIDNDFDGLFDEDTYRFDFKLVGYINLKNPAESFTLSSGQPRGVVSSEVVSR